MRLLNTETLEVEEFLTEIPKYAILSHTWAKDEVTFQDMQILQKAKKKAGLEPEGARRQIQLSKVEEIQKKAGWSKIEKACEYVRKYRFKWIWIDTCCIDKSSSAELSEALNSMYQYYRDGQVCVAYLSDFQKDPSDVAELLDGLKGCKWFTRGWTLQELIAPSRMAFLDKDWNIIGTRYSMRHVVSEVTSIPVRVFEKGELKDYSCAQKMSWAASRKTTREEDMAYCLMGLFGVNMPPIYGEGGAKAFMRLQQEIIKYSDDRSIFAWVTSQMWSRGLFASSPSEFSFSGGVKKSDSKYLGDKSSFSFGNNGIRIHLPLQPLPDIGKDIFFASLQCQDANGIIGIYIQKDGYRYTRWCPHFPLHHVHTDKTMGNLEEVVVKESAGPRQRIEPKNIPIEFKLDSQLTLLSQVDSDSSTQSFTLSPTLLYPESFRFRIRNGNKLFDVGLRNNSYDIIPVVGFLNWDDARDSHLLPIGYEHSLASCFIHRTGDSSDQRIVEINYIPSSSSQFEYCRQIDAFQCTSHVLRSVILNFAIDAGTYPFSFIPSSLYPSHLHWGPGLGMVYWSISYPGEQSDVHCVLGYEWFSKRVFIALGLRTDSETSIPWIDIWISDNELPIFDVWKSYQPLGSRYQHRPQSKSTATLDDKSFTVTVEEISLVNSWYHVRIEEMARVQLGD